MTTIRDLIELLEDHADELGDDYPVLYYNPLTQGYEELEVTISSSFIREDSIDTLEYVCVLIHSSDEVLENDEDDTPNGMNEEEDSEP